MILGPYIVLHLIFHRQGPWISRVHREDGVEEGYFHIVSLAFGLRFPLPRFILEVLNDYKIALS